MNSSSPLDLLSVQQPLATAAALPDMLWQAYVEHLWNYHEESWVAKAAYTSRLLAFFVVFPFIFLTLLDVASYVIARTLGVIDDVKASTSDKAASILVKSPAAPLPTILVEASTPKSAPAPAFAFSNDSGSTSQESFSSAGTELADDRGRDSTDMSRASSASASTTSLRMAGERLPSLDVSTPHAYFASEEENSLRLSGVGVFSPATSQPPSPTLTRRRLPPEFRMTSADEATKEDEGLSFRPRARRAGSEGNDD
ncbi:hypothetical protein HGRIS_002562 [Hohenbuehelia grisea]|uniref:Proteophosphoglycan ppg4 n=1 Tax=Hohenbuehelia grisea TaxID=104357 RepID=A0ABR3JKW9_9AGAR